VQAVRGASSTFPWDVRKPTYGWRAAGRCTFGPSVLQTARRGRPCLGNCGKHFHDRCGRLSGDLIPSTTMRGQRD